ncbi:MAG: PEP-utilizing enzyme [Patescibacteria group bacterium]|jgi:phosphohistidine swiveling domain-containing protein
MDLSKLYQTQISLTEWFQRMGHKDSEAHRKEDNEKRERLAVLNDLFGLPFDRPTQFPASEVTDRSDRFVAFVDERGDELCALRLIPFDASLPKLRTRGASIRDSLDWFALQNIDPSNYKADFVPHAANQEWSTIFVVNEHGALGQIVAGTHTQLTQGFYNEGIEPMTFSWDGKSVEVHPKNHVAAEHLFDVFELLHVKEKSIRDEIVKRFDAKFFGEYLCGYFESISSKEFGFWIVDWNRLLGDAYSQLRSPLLTKEGSGEVDRKTLHGQIGSSGIASGKARVIRAAELASAEIDVGDILITDITTPDFLPLMQKAGGVVTRYGGILSHAAIVCRELGKPCLTNVKDIFEKITDGIVVEVDGEEGVLRIM